MENSLLQQPPVERTYWDAFFWRDNPLIYEQMIKCGPCVNPTFHKIWRVFMLVFVPFPYMGWAYSHTGIIYLAYMTHWGVLSVSFQALFVFLATFFTKNHTFLKVIYFVQF